MAGMAYCAAMARRRTDSRAKTRTDCVLRSLPEERQLAVYSDLNERPAAKVQASLAEDGITVSLTALYNFAAWWRSELRFIEAEAERDSLHARLMLRNPPVKLAKVEAWGDSLFIQQTVATGNLEGYVKMRGITERARKTRMEERRLEMLERREAKLEAMERELRERREAGGLSPEALELMESMLGMIQA